MICFRAIAKYKAEKGRFMISKCSVGKKQCWGLFRTDCDLRCTVCSECRLKE